MDKRNNLFCAKAKLFYLFTFVLACTSKMKAPPPNAPTVPSAELISRCGCKLNIDPTCTRVLEFERAPKGGVGHQLSELVFALQLASFQNAALKMKPFDDVISTDSGDSYRFLNSLLGLDFLWRNSQFDTSQLRRVPFSFSGSDPGQCDLIFHGRYGDCKGGGKMGCFNSPVQRLAFSRFAPCLQDISKSGTWAKRRPKELSSEEFNVVWHVRLGDIGNPDVELHKPGDGYYENISTLLAPTFKAAKQVKHYVLSTWSMLEDSASERYETMFTYLLDSPIFLNVDVEDAFLYFLHADVLVGSGSSFPTVAPLFSSSVVPVNIAPKHGWNHFAEYIPYGIDLELDSSFVTPTPAIIHRLQSAGKCHKLHVGYCTARQREP